MIVLTAQARAPKPGNRLLRWLAMIIMMVVTTTLVADDDVDFFEARIRPVLIEHCYECHSEASDANESGLRVDTRDAIRRGGDRGPAIVPGKPHESLLLTAISHADLDLKMPPRVERLSAAVVADFKRWIERGAVDPRVNADAESAVASDLWAYQPMVSHPAPVVPNDWAENEIDFFVWETLRRNKLRPAGDANPETLLRRLCFDLTGLPPTPKDIMEFAARVQANGIEIALTQRVDALLDSPAFGERWGRHWLDVARFAESSGKEANITFPYAWRYRDYVIDGLNNDVAFDRFLTEQIAGDLLPAADEAERTRLLIATGFLALGPKNLDATDPRQFEADLIDEQIDAVTRVFMASSVACARCHDHKFDPFSMEDYYALGGIFSSSKTYFGTAVSPANRVGGDPLPLPRLKTTPVLHKSISPQRVAQLQAEKAALQDEQKQKGSAFTLRDALRVFWRTGAIDGQLEKVDEGGQALPLAMGVLDSDQIHDAPLLHRGEVSRVGPIIPRAFPAAIQTKNQPEINQHRSGRLALAKWLTQDDHPLTARVAVNRVWSHLFGSGIVGSVDDFGSTGQQPSHPELLDHLATRFVANGWSIKQLIRQIVTSRIYRQSSQFNAAAFRIDPENRLLWRMSKRRIEAEAMRDAMLSISGELDLRRPVGSLVGRVIGDRPVSLVGLDKRLPPDLDGAVHRSVYLPVLRDRLPDVLEVFDFAEPSLVTGQRETTNVPTQALYLMNSEFVRQRSAAMAARLRKETKDRTEFMQQAFLYCYGRLPTSDETQRVRQFLGEEPETADADQQAIDCCHALLSTVEFRVLD